jgi:prepilin-type N-terminal cleavage/methylation domain-containing protein
MKQNSRLYNARGMTLIEVMIAVGIMSIVSLTLSSLMSYLMRSQGGIKNSSDVQNIVNELQSITSVNSRLCKNALIPETGTDVISDESLGQKISLRGISYPIRNGTDTYGNTIFEQNTSSFLIETGMPLKNNANLKVSKIYLINEEMLSPTSIKDPTNPTKTIELKIWRSKIKILFEKVNPTKGSAGPKNLFREISLDTAYYAKSSGADAGKIQSCSSGAPDQTCKDYFAGESMILNADVPPKCRIPMIVSNSMFKLKVKKTDSDKSTPDYYTGLTLAQDTKIGIGTTHPLAQLHIATRAADELLLEHSQGTDVYNRVDFADLKNEDSSDFRSPGIISETTHSGLLVDSHLEGNILVRGKGTKNYSSLCLGNEPSSTDDNGWCMAYDISKGLSFKSQAFSNVDSDPAFYIHDDNRIIFGSNNDSFKYTTLLIDNSSTGSKRSGIASLSIGENYLALNSSISKSCLYLGNSMSGFSEGQNWSLCRGTGTPGDLTLYNTSGETSFNIFKGDKVKFETNGTGIDLTIAGSSSEKNFSFENGKITADNQELKNGLTINSSISSKVTIDNTKIDAPELTLNIKTINASGKTTIANGLDLTGNLSFTNGSINNVTNISANGNITVTGIVTASSDINLKKNIEIIPNSLERILKVKGVLFDWIDPQKDSRRQMGLIAQNVEKVFPELVYTNDHGIKSIAYQNLVAPLIEAVKSLWQMVQDLKQEVLNLKQELLALKTQQQNWNQKMNQQESELKQIKMALCQSQPKLQMCYGFR